MTLVARSLKPLCYCLICIALGIAMAGGVSIAATAPATTWEHSYGSDSVGDTYTDFARSVWQTSDNGFIIAGTTANPSPSGSARAMVVKTDWLGNEQWVKLLDDGAEATFIRQTSDSGYILVGTMGGNPYVEKLGANGDKVWAKVYDRPDGRTGNMNTILETSDGGYIFSGQVLKNDQNTQWDPYVCKIDATGNIQWQKFYKSDYGPSEYSVSLWPTSDGGYILGGSNFYRNPTTGSVKYPIALLKIDADGNEVWYKVFTEIPGRYDSGLGQIQQTRDGGYIWGGSNGKMHIVKTDANGNHQWNVTYEHYGQIWSIQQTWDDGYVITGGPTNPDDILVFRTDSAGKLLWEKTLKGQDLGKGQSVLQIGNGSYIVAGLTVADTKNAQQDFYLAEIAKDFTPVPNAQFIAPRGAYVMDAGKFYKLTVTMANNGTMPWTFQDGTILAPFYGSEDTALFSINNYTIPIGTVIRPGQSISVDFTYTAPAMNGTYHPAVSMYRINHGYFGEPARLEFRVVNGTPDTRTTPTGVPTGTPTSGASPTAGPTAQPSPTAIPATGTPEPGGKGGLPCLPSLLLPVLIVSLVAFGTYWHRK